MKITHYVLIAVGIIIAVIIVFFAVGIFFFNKVNSPSANGAEAIDKTLSDQYYYKDNGIVHVRFANFFSLGPVKIEGADLSSFKVLAYNMAKDKNHVYFDRKIIEGADPTTFELISGTTKDKEYTSYYYTKDANKVFYFDKPIVEANSKTFRYLWGEYSKDINAVFYGDNKIKDISVNPIAIENDPSGYYLNIENTIYYKGQPIPKANPDSFRYIQDHYAKDNQAVFIESKRLEGADSKSFRIINKDYQKDKDRLYYKSRALANSDPDSYIAIDNLFSKDKNNLYYLGNIVINPDVKAYSVKKIKTLSDYSNYRALNYGEHQTLFVEKDELKKIVVNYSLYNNEIYCFENRLIGADYKNFKVFRNSENLYSTDKKNIYYMSSIIKGADLASFEIINSKFTKDKNHVYFLENQLPGVDPKTFKYHEGIYDELDYFK